MVFQLNTDYIRSNRGMIVTGETVSNGNIYEMPNFLIYLISLIYYDKTNYRVLLRQVLGGIGGIIALVEFSGFMSFCLWTTFMISGALVLLNVLNVYQALHTKFSFLTKVVIIVILQFGLHKSQVNIKTIQSTLIVFILYPQEFGYVALMSILYIVGAIWSIVSWGISFVSFFY